MQTAILAAGCFWGVQAIFSEVKGVESSQAGYVGGMTSNPSYHDICTGKTGHAEAVKIDFHEEQISFKEILDIFFRLHDPTQIDQQGNDQGSQYRSAIFFMDDEQKNIALEFIKFLDVGDYFRNDVATTVEYATHFYEAEDYHQNYMEKNPGGYMCHLLRQDYNL